MTEKHRNNPEFSPPGIKRIWNRLKDRPDSEHEQAAVRVIFPIALLVYLFLHKPAEPALDPSWTTGLIFSSAFLVFSIGLFVSILIWPGVSATRRIVAMCADNGVFTLGLIETGALGAPWYAIYLWVAFGNGFRFGERYLYLSALLSIIGFSTVLIVTPYWQDNVGLGLGLLAALFVLPGYAAFLIRRINFERQRAEAANQAKSEFLARMSHEMRTPLNGVIVTGELLKSCPLDPEEKEYAETIYTSGNALLNLIEDILDISKIEEGKLVIEQTDFDLHAMLNGTIRMLTPQAAGKGLHLSTHITLDTPYRLIGDPLHLRQILINLIGNAIKFTQDGRIDVTCRSIGKTENHVLIRFEVTDTGIGISEEMQEQIFEKFTQADESTTRRFGGSGLGTTISKQLVELMNGRIGVKSTPNIGSTFWFDIEFELQEAAVNPEELLQIRECRVLRLCPAPQTETDTSRFLQEWKIPFAAASHSSDVLNRLLDATSSGAPYELLVLDGVENVEIHVMLETLDKDLEIPWLAIVVILPPEQQLHLPERRYRNPVYTLEEPINKAFLFNALHAFHGHHRAGHDIINLFDRMAAPHLTNRQLNVLVADDNAINRMLIGRILDRGGHRHVSVGDGREALAALEASRFDLVIVDMRMPDVGGLETYKMFRFAHPDDDTPFIVVTADATTRTRQECEEAGIEHYLTKPLSAEKLITTINQIQMTGDLQRGQSDADVTEDDHQAETIDSNLLRDISLLAPDEKFMHNLLENFLNDSRILLDTMAECIDNGDAEGFSDAAHGLKGSAANIALPRLAALSYEAEQMDDHRLTAEGAPMLQVLRDEFRRSTDILREEILRTKTADC